MMQQDLRDVEFAVFDLETTGLNSSRGDKIVEISIQRVSGKGELIQEYTSVVNPNRDAGPQYIHHLTAKQLSQAPQFEVIAGDILACLADAVIVAHNISFDRRFLRAAFRDIGIELPPFKEICTMRLAAQLFPWTSKRTLASFCEALEIPLVSAHSAECDTKATAQLLLACIEELIAQGSTTLQQSGIEDPNINNQQWPTLPVSGIRVTRESADEIDKLTRSRVATLVDKLPLQSTGQANIDGYLDLLAQALEDRIITDLEFEELESVALDYGLSSDDIITAHRRYVDHLIQLALEDSVITDFERNDIYDVAVELGFPEEEIPQLIEKQKTIAPDQTFDETTRSNESLDGLTICFTGQLLCTYEDQGLTRSVAMTLCENQGLIPAKSVTKKLDILIVADPHTMSSKAKKARDYGIRIIAERELWHILGVPVG